MHCGVGENEKKYFYCKKNNEVYPNVPREEDFAMWEIFKQDRIISSNKTDREAFLLKSAQYRYSYEAESCFLERYFNIISPYEYCRKSILDLGCFTGGRLVFWKEKYRFGTACGIDINPIFAEAGRLFAKEKQVSCHFEVGVGEELPYNQNTFDFIASYDVFEHVQDIEKVLKECFRVLKPRGRLLVVFPAFYQPLEAHLGDVTRMPALHWFFSGETLAKAAYEIIQERGKAAYWYAPESPNLKEWERLYSLNGITVKKFRRLIKQQNDWRVVYWGKDPILSDGRRSKLKVFRWLRKLFILPARLPLLEELFLGRICCILQKPAE